MQLVKYVIYNKLHIVTKTNNFLSITVGQNKIFNHVTFLKLITQINWDGLIKITDM